MHYELIPATPAVGEKGLFRLLLTNAPDNVAPLEMAPAAMETELSRGLWVVLVLAVWSAPDLAAIPLASKVGARLGRVACVGIRPFDHQAEHAAWCPALSATVPTPVWLVLRNGELLGHTSGAAGIDDVMRGLRMWLPR